MAKKRNRITSEMSKTIAESSPLIKKTPNVTTEEDNSKIYEIDLSSLQKNPYQPRIDINLHSLNELISSIEENGLMQPIVITEKTGNKKNTIIAGHRRYEAFKIMGKQKIPAIVMKNIADKDLAVLSLTENLMRENLHPIENAIAMKNILDNKIVESQNKLAQYLGLSKGYISKLMNILKLPSSLIELVKKENYKDINILVLLNKLSSEEQMLEIYQQIKQLSRFEAEKYIKKSFNNLPIKDQNIMDTKITKTKIYVNIDAKKLSEDQRILIKKELNKLNNLIKEWKS